MTTAKITQLHAVRNFQPLPGNPSLIDKYLSEATPNVYGAILCNFYAKCRETLATQSAFEMAYGHLRTMIGEQVLPIEDAQQLTSAFESDELALKRCPTCKVIFIDTPDPDLTSSYCNDHR